MDSTCVLIGQQVCFHSAMKRKNDVRNTIGCLQIVRIYSFMEEIKSYVYICASYIVFPFAKLEIFINEIKHVLLGKVCENSQAGENPVLRFEFLLTCFRILTSVRLGFSQAMKVRRMFYFLNGVQLGTFLIRIHSSWLYRCEPSKTFVNWVSSQN